MYQSILVPLDGSSHSDKALTHAAALSKDGVRITLLRVVHSVDQLVGTRQPDPASGVELTEDLLAREAYDEEIRDARRHLADSRAAFADKSDSVQVMISEGDPVDEILNAVGKVSADLIVLSAFGRSASSTPAAAGVFGKIADAVLKNSKIPVLVVKPWV